MGNETMFNDKEDKNFRSAGGQGGVEREGGAKTRQTSPREDARDIDTDEEDMDSQEPTRRAGQQRDNTEAPSRADRDRSNSSQAKTQSSDV